MHFLNRRLSFKRYVDDKGKNLDSPDSKRHQDLMEIRREKLKLCEKQLNIQQKNMERHQNMMVKMMETKIEMMDNFLKKASKQIF